MGINESETRLYTLLEGQVAGEPDKTRRINECDLAKQRYTGRSYIHPLDPNGTNIGGTWSRSTSAVSSSYATIEDVLVQDPRTLLVVNGGGRELASDNTEFLKIRLPFSLNDDDDHEHHHGRGRDHCAGGYAWDDD